MYSGHTIHTYFTVMISGYFLENYVWWTFSQILKCTCEMVVRRIKFVPILIYTNRVPANYLYSDISHILYFTANTVHKISLMKLGTAILGRSHFTRGTNECLYKCTYRTYAVCPLNNYHVSC